MRILSIETSCDETAIAILECEGGTTEGGAASIKILGNAVHSQIATHREFGGVYPAVAKREHAKNATPLLASALSQAGMLNDAETPIPDEFDDLLSREHELAAELRDFLSKNAVPDVDAIAVTYGPGLEPALWVGINFAKALALVWNKPLVPVNHMEGHMLVSLAQKANQGDTLILPDEKLPLLGLLVSGGHTELVVMKDWLSYEVLGETRDDAVGEAFDKVARMLGLPYPGGPEISKLAEEARQDPTPPPFKLPKPMISTEDCDFSFSGLKTAVLYLLRDRELTEPEKAKLAEAFEDTVADVLYAKTKRAIEQTEAKSLLIGGGVSANTHLSRVFRERLAEDYPDVTLYVSERSLSGDNAVMIGIAGYFRALRSEYKSDFIADGTLALV